MTYIIKKIRKIKSLMSNCISTSINPIKKLLIYIDFAWSIIFYGVNIDEYFQYQFYKRRHADRKNFIVYRKRMRIVRTCNDKNDRNIFDFKPKFNKLFNKYLGRDWLFMDECSFGEFTNFISKNKKIFVKPVDSFYGLGVRIQNVNQNDNLRELYEQLKEERVMIEQIIEQYNELAEFNPTSVNTLRVVTLLCNDGTAKVMTANLRCGNKGKHADNFHHGGIASLIDVETGIVGTPGIDRNFKKYINHPTSKKQIVGFKVPFWEKIVEMVKSAAQIVPTVRYVGWDVAITKDGTIILVEGNAAADPDVSQMPDQIGKWYLYKNEIEQINK